MVLFGFYASKSTTWIVQCLACRKYLKVIEKNTCAPMFIAALFTIARTWKQPRCPSPDEWIRNLWYTYTMEYYPAIEKNIFESVLMKWMNLEPIIQWGWCTGTAKEAALTLFEFLVLGGGKQLISSPPHLSTPGYLEKTLESPLDCKEIQPVHSKGD